MPYFNSFEAATFSLQFQCRCTKSIAPYCLEPQVRRATGLSQVDIDAILEFIALAGIPTPIDFLWRPNLKDESDNMFVELAVASGSEYLITRNRRHYSIGNTLLFDSFTVVTPAEFLTQWRKIHG